MSIVVVEILIILALFLANGIFAMSEMAVVSSRKSRLKQMAADGDAGAVAALRLAEAPNRFLPTVQIGITMIGLLAGAFGGATLAAVLAGQLKALPGFAPYADAVSVGLVVVALGFLSVIVGELAPKRIALAAPEKIASRISRPIEWLARLTQPIVQMLSGATDFLLRLLRVKPDQPDPVSEDEVRLLLCEGRESGVFHKEEPRMVESVLSFDRRPVREIMTPRAKLVFVNLTDTQETLWHKIVVSGHSSYPVCGEDRDHIVGVITVKSVYANLAAGTTVRVVDLLTTPLFVAPEKAVMDVLNEFKRTGLHLAVVREADGRAVGLVTLVDVLEAIVGDIPSLEDRLRPEARQRADGSWLVDGHYDLTKLSALLGVPFTEHASDDGTSLAAFIGHRLAGAPREGDTLVCAGLRFEIIDMDRTSVDKILIQPEPARVVPIP
ncbi:MAG: hemolysin family protein [Chthoniobacter sp.]|nr:hemolysin family protein [Chthoniobacter sp.]